MNLGLLNQVSIRIYTYFKVRDSLILFILGSSLLATGLHGVGVSEEPHTQGHPLAASQSIGAPVLAANPGLGAPAAFARPAPGAIARPAQQTIWLGIAQQSPWTGVAQSSPYKGVEAPLNWNLAQQPENPGIGVAEANDVPYDDSLIRFSVGNLYKFIEGAFGALIVVGAGIGAVIAATVGAYKSALALLVTAVGAFILRAYVSLFFGTNYDDYTVGVDGVNPN